MTIVQGTVNNSAPGTAQPGAATAPAGGLGATEYVTQAFQALVPLLSNYSATERTATPAQLANLQQQILQYLVDIYSFDPTMFTTLTGSSAAAVTNIINQVTAPGATPDSVATAAEQISNYATALSTSVQTYIGQNPNWNSPTWTPAGAVSNPFPGSQGGTPVSGYTPPAGSTPGGTVTPVGNNPSGGGGSVSPGTLASEQIQGAASAQIDAWATSIGLGSLSGWINDQIKTLAGLGMNASDIASTINSTINTAPGFDALMPGYNQRIANGYTNTDAQTGAGIAGYLAYRQQVQAMAETAGMVPGTISAQMIGNAWAGDVSTTELSERITQEYTNAVNAMPAVQQQLQAYGYVSGISPGQLASYYLNPANTVNALQQQFNAAEVGAEGVLTGFGQLGQSQAYALQAFLSNQGQNNLSAPQAANFFAGPLGNGLNSLAMMEQTGFSKPQLGTAPTGPGVVSSDQLIAAGEGNASDVAAVQRAAQTRAAPAAGGGGFSADQAGVGGAGFGSG